MALVTEVRDEHCSAVSMRGDHAVVIYDKHRRCLAVYAPVLQKASL